MKSWIGSALIFVSGSLLAMPANQAMLDQALQNMFSDALVNQGVGFSLTEFRTLIEAGANADKDFDIVRNNTDYARGIRPLLIALELQPREPFLEVEKILLRHGVDINRPDHHGEIPLNLAIALGRDHAKPIPPKYSDIEINPALAAILAEQPNMEPPSNSEHRIRPPLIAAIEDCQYSTFMELLKRKANPNSIDFNGANPLYVAAYMGSKCESSMVVAFIDHLLAAGASPKKRGEGITKFDAIWSLARDGGYLRPRDFRYLTDQLLAAGDDVNFANELGSTPLMEAARLGNYMGVRIFLEKGADRKLKDRSGRTAYDFAVEALKDAHDPNRNMSSYEKTKAELIEGTLRP